MAAKVAKEHGGSIDVASELGKGTCFNVWLPEGSPGGGGKGMGLDEKRGWSNTDQALVDLATDLSAIW